MDDFDDLIRIVDRGLEHEHGRRGKVYLRHVRFVLDDSRGAYDAMRCAETAHGGGTISDKTGSSVLDVSPDNPSPAKQLLEMCPPFLDAAFIHGIVLEGRIDFVRREILRLIELLR